MPFFQDWVEGINQHTAVTTMAPVPYQPAPGPLQGPEEASSFSYSQVILHRAALPEFLTHGLQCTW